MGVCVRIILIVIIIVIVVLFNFVVVNGRTSHVKLIGTKYRIGAIFIIQTVALQTVAKVNIFVIASIIDALATILWVVAPIGVNITIIEVESAAPFDWAINVW